MVTHEGRVIYKVNQDRGLISHPSLASHRHTVFGVFDGTVWAVRRGRTFCVDGLCACGAAAASVVGTRGWFASGPLSPRLSPSLLSSRCRHPFALVS